MFHYGSLWTFVFNERDLSLDFSKIYVPNQISLGTCVACRLDIDFVHSCHDSAIQASLMALAAPRIRAIRAIRVQEKIRIIRVIRVQNMYSVVLEKR